MTARKGYQLPPEEEGAELDPDLKIETEGAESFTEKPTFRTITYYETTYGSIVSYCQLALEDEIPELEGHAYRDEYFSDEVYYIDPITFVATPKPLFDYYITVTDNTISGLPVGTKAYYYDTCSEEDDGVLELVVAEEEDVQVTLWHPIYHLWVGLVHCVPA